MITLQQLEYILAVDKHRHFVDASKACFVTQPTLSMQIKKLEEDLETVIFDRSKHPILPTEVGGAIIEQARKILSETKKIDEIIQIHNEVISGELHIGIIPTLAPYLIPLFVGQFTRDYPSIKVRIVELLTTEILDQLQNDTIDIGILVTPIDRKGISTKVLFFEEMFVLANENHPFHLLSEVDPIDIESPDLWMLTEGHCFRSQVVNLCNYNPENSNRFAIEYESGSLETLKRMVETEGGYTLIPELAVDKYSKENSVLIPFKGVSPLREVSLAFSRNFAKQRLIDLVGKSIQNAVPAEMLNAQRGGVVEWW